MVKVTTMVVGVDAAAIDPITSTDNMGMLSVTFNVKVDASLPGTNCAWTTEPQLTVAAKSTAPTVNLLSNPPRALQFNSGLGKWVLPANEEIGGGQLSEGDTLVVTIEAAWQCGHSNDRLAVKPVPAPSA